MEPYRNKITIEWEDAVEDGKQGYHINVDADVNASLFDVAQVFESAFKNVKEGMLKEVLDGSPDTD